MAGELTVEQLAEWAGTSADRVREMSLLGILEPDGSRYDETDIGRAVVVEALASTGVSLADVAAAVDSGALSLAWFGGILPPVPDVRSKSFREAIEEADLPLRLVEQLFAFWGVALPPLESRIREDDAVILEHIGRAFAAFGREERMMMGSARYFGDNVRRMAQSQMDFFRREMIEPPLAAGVSVRDVIQTVNPFIADVVRPAVRDLLQWLYRRHIDTLNIQLLVQLVEVSLQDAGVEIPRVARPPAIAFLDLSGFTRLTDEAGDDEAVGLATALSDLVRTVPAEFGGTAVKLLGDGVMFHFPDPAPALDCAVRLVAEVERRGLPPARVGIHAGPVVFRDGDYFGRTVNVAARITDYARPHEILVSDAVEGALDDGRVTLDEIGSVALKGISEPVRLFALRVAP